MSDDQLERMRRIAYLHGVVAVLIDELDRIYKPGRFILWQMLENGRGKRLLFQADAVLSEIARLEGVERTPLEPISVRMPWFHPLTWLGLQWGLGIFQAYMAIDYALDGRWGWAAFNASGVLACLCWRLPSFKLAKQGRWI
jgi:hypothetical protein